MRELTDVEKDFINRKKNSAKMLHAEREKTVSERRVKKYDRPAWLLLSNWLFALSIVPLIVLGIFMINFSRIQNMLGGAEVVQELSRKGLDPKYFETLEILGMNWIPAFLEVYQYRYIIMGGIVSVSILIIALGVVARIVEKQKRDEANERFDAIDAGEEPPLTRKEKKRLKKLQKVDEKENSVEKIEKVDEKENSEKKENVEEMEEGVVVDE